jgi:nucleotide-binding universal stress UspA family protein
MLPFRKILFPVDFSDRSRGATRHVENLVGRFGAELLLLHVVQPYEYWELPSNRIGDAEAALARFLPKDFEHFRVRRLLLRGDPAEQIVATQRAEGVDLVMMPTSGHGRLRRFLIGSVSAKVLHDVTCPVWTGTHMEETPPVEQLNYRRLVCAVDFTWERPRVAEAANSWAREYGATITVVHVGAASDPHAQEECTRRLRRDFPDAEVCLRRGSVAEAVHELALRQEADLVIIGRGGPEGSTARLGRDAYAIIRESPCPVLSV